MGNTEIKENALNIGDTIKIGRTVYTIMAEFEDTYNVSYRKEPVTEHLYVGRKTTNWGGYEYSNIIRWQAENDKWMLRS